MILVFFFLVFSLKQAFSLSSFTLIKRLFSSSFLSAIRVVSPAYLKLLIFLPAVLTPAYNSSSLVFLMLPSAYKLNSRVSVSCLLCSFLSPDAVRVCIYPLPSGTAFPPTLSSRSRLSQSTGLSSLNYTAASPELSIYIR